MLITFNNSPDAHIAVLYQNDDFGRDYLDGLTEELGALAARKVVATASYETSEPTVDSQIIQLEVIGCRHSPHRRRTKVCSSGDSKDV